MDGYEFGGEAIIYFLFIVLMDSSLVHDPINYMTNNSFVKVSNYFDKLFNLLRNKTIHSL